MTDDKTYARKEVSRIASMYCDPDEGRFFEVVNHSRIDKATPEDALKMVDGVYDRLFA